MMMILKYRLLMALSLTMIAAPAWAQTVRDKNGDPLYHYSQEGKRNYRVDNAGNKQGYSETLPNGTVQFRDKVGNLRGTETPHR